MLVDDPMSKTKAGMSFWEQRGKKNEKCQKVNSTDKIFSCSNKREKQQKKHHTVPEQWSVHRKLEQGKRAFHTIFFNLCWV